MDDPRKIKTEFLKGVSRYLRGSIDKNRLGYCSKHRIVHTGKICYLALIDLALFRLTKDEIYIKEAKDIVLGVAKMTRQDIASNSTIFYPGALDHRNAANHPIDSGAAVDCLSTLLISAPEFFNDKERAVVEAAVNSCSKTYLVMAARTKAVPAQRLWAATGLASAYLLLKDMSFKEAALETIPLLMKDAYPDGGIPYLPLAEKMGEHCGQADITSYYHSRCLGFAFHILEILDEKPSSEQASFLEKSLDLLVAFYGGNGLKLCLNESKQWYWESAYEVASHSFDIHALVKGWIFFNRPDYRDCASLSFKQLMRHVKNDGGIDSSSNRSFNFQCRLFWNSHVAWIARVIDDLPLEESDRKPKTTKINSFPDSGIVRCEAPGYTATIRGKKKPINISFGSTIGGGCLTYLGFPEKMYTDQLNISKWSSIVPGSFRIDKLDKKPFLERIKSFTRINKKDIKFRAYITYMELMGGRPLFAFCYPFRHILYKFCSEMRDLFTSHWDCETAVVHENDSVSFEGCCSKRSGERLKGASFKKIYQFHDNSIDVEDRLLIPSREKGLYFGTSRIFKNLKVDIEGSLKEFKTGLSLEPAKYPARIVIRYTISK